MIIVFSWQNSFSLCPTYSKAKFACYSRYHLTSYFCIPVPYNEKDIFWGYQFQKSCRSSQNSSTSFSSALVVGAQIWITPILNGFALEANRDHSVIFEIASKYCISVEKAMASCRGPAQVDPGNSKRGRHWQGKTYLFINIRLDQEEIVQQEN